MNLGPSLYYANGGPGPADKLLRVDVPPGYDGEHAVWFSAPAFRWTPEFGWFREPHAQNDIQQTGDFALVDVSKVPEIQKQMREEWDKV